MRARTWQYILELILEAFLRPEDFHLPNGMTAALCPACHRQTADTTRMLTPENPSPDGWAHILHRHHLIGDFYCHQNERAESETQRQPPRHHRQGWWLKWHLLFMRKNHSLGWSESSKFPAAPPPPRAEAAPPPAQRALFIHWFSILQSRGRTQPSPRLLVGTGWLPGPGKASSGGRHLLCSLQCLISVFSLPINKHLQLFAHTHSLCSDATGLQRWGKKVTVLSWLWVIYEVL